MIHFGLNSKMPETSSTYLDKPIVFITGNSRSGTTMMMRIMNNHSEAHSINEPHFFEKLWSPQDENKELIYKDAFDLYAKLFTGQRAGFFEKPEHHVEKYRKEIDSIISSFQSPPTRMEAYAQFMHYEAGINGKQVPCEKTPQNVFYLKEILDHFPNARVINMIRDPRGVMLSQKRKWKRRKLGADFITKKEVLRLRINYHPITIAKLWNSAVGAIKPFEDHKGFINVRFEDLLDKPEETVQRICEFTNLTYEPSMLDVPHAGSSSEADKKDVKGIKKGRAKGWEEKGLTAAEIRICQDTCKELMDKYSYAPIQVKPSFGTITLQYISFPFKLVLALFWNLNRMRSIGDALKRRLAKN